MATWVEALTSTHARIKPSMYADRPSATAAHARITLLRPPRSYSRPPHCAAPAQVSDYCPRVLPHFLQSRRAHSAAPRSGEMGCWGSAMSNDMLRPLRMVVAPTKVKLWFNIIGVHSGSVYGRAAYCIYTVCTYCIPYVSYKWCRIFAPRN